MKLAYLAGAVAGALCVLGGYAVADEPAPPPPVVITLTLPDSGRSAEFVCTQRINYSNAFTEETPK